MININREKNKKDIPWTYIVYTLLIVVIILLSISIFIIFQYQPRGSPPVVLIDFSVEDREDVWEVEIEVITGNSVPNDDLHLTIRHSDVKEEQEEVWTDMKFEEVQIRGEEDYGIRLDLADEDELSVGDRIIIDKEGGSEKRLKPGDEIGIGGTVDGIDCPFTYEELP